MELIEREPFLQALEQWLRQAAEGSGCLVFLGGEAGAGKTALVQCLAQRVRKNARVALGACDPLSTPRPLGPLLDAASALGLEGAFQGGIPRIRVFQVVLAVLCMGPKPTLLVFEDAHWADEATLDLLRFLGRRIAQTRALMIASYRDDEIGFKHPLRVVLGDLSTSPAVRRMELPPLSEAAVAYLARNSALDAGALYRQTAGNPFFVTEILSSGAPGIPPTVRDAVLARAARLSPSGRGVLEAAAVIGSRVEPWLLAEVVGAEVQAVDECLAIGILRAQDDAQGAALAFRHELARQAILEAIPPGRKQVLHRPVLDALRARRSEEPARLAHHAEAAGEPEAVLEYAPKAARRASGLGAHREAAAQYARALRFADPLPPKERAALLENYASECGLIDQLAEAISAYQAALEIWCGERDPLKQGELLDALSVQLVRAGRNAEAEAASRAAIEILEALPPSVQLARAYRSQAYLRMLNRDRDEAILWGQKAIALAQHFQDLPTLTGAYNAVGSARLVAGEVLEGQEALQTSLRLALEAGLDAEVARAYTNLGSGSGEVYQFALAERFLAEGIAYASEHDLDLSRGYMVAWQALTRLYLGRWSEAAEAALAILQRPGIAAISRIMALVALGRLRARRGDPEVWTVLDEALELADRTATLQRIAPVRAARAEAAWLAGDRERTALEAQAAYGLALQHRHPWFAGELAYWQWKAGELQDVPDWIAQPFRLQLEGGWAEAAAGWRALGCPYEAARALSEGDEPAALKEALLEFERLGATPMAQALSRRLRELGVKGIPRGPRPSTRANPAGLTQREIEILCLLALGLRNKAIAKKLFLSAKTVDHHISSLLSKLGVKSRLEAVRKASRLGLLQNGESPLPK